MKYIKITDDRSNWLGDCFFYQQLYPVYTHDGRWSGVLTNEGDIYWFIEIIGVVDIIEIPE